MDGFFDLLTDLFSRENQQSKELKDKENAENFKKMLPNHLQQLSILCEESQKTKKLSWEIDGEEVIHYLN